MGDERGSATVLTIGIMAALVTVGLIMLRAGESAIQVVRAQAVADLAAIAAADSLRGLNTGFPCATAASVAEANATILNSCRIEGDDAIVTITVQLNSTEHRAEARAGPP